MNSAEKVVLVIDYSFNWTPLFKNTGVRVEQTEWSLIDAHVSSSGVLSVDVQPSHDPFVSSQSKERRVVSPSCVLVRNFPMGLRGETYKNQVMAFLIAGTPMVNGCQSVLASIERSQLYAELKRVEAKLGRDVFPLIHLAYHPNTRGHGRGKEEEFRGQKSVLKAGSCNAGFGKMMLETDRQRDDAWSVLCTQSDYVTEEPFIEHEYEYRVQWIGGHIRCFKRTSDNEWKNNRGNLMFESLPVEPRHQLWCETCATVMFNGDMQVFALDVLRRRDASEVIIEINPSANGLMYDFEEEDCKRIRDVVLSKIK